MANVLRPVLNKMYPANLYSRPAVAPLLIGVGGSSGLAQRNLNQSYEQTLRRLATSPFVVNNNTAVDLVRQNGTNSGEFYDAMGVVGGVVGAGVGALAGGNFLQNPLVKGANGKLQWQSPIRKDWSFSNASKRQNTSKAFRPTNKVETDLTKKYSKEIDAFNKAKNTFDRVSKNTSDEVIEYYKAVKNLNGKTGDALKEAQDALAKLTKPTDYDNLVKAYEQADKAKDIAGKALKTAVNSDDLVKAADTAEDVTSAMKVAKAYSKGVEEAVDAGATVAKSTGFIPYVGLAADVTGTALDTVGFVQSLQADYDNAGQAILNIGLYGTQMLGDITSLVGDVLAFTPFFAVGEVLDVIGTIVSMGAGALHGWLLGESVGHSLTPEGLRIQQAVMENTYSSFINRPLTSISTMASMFAVPALLQGLSRFSGSTRVVKVNGREIRKPNPLLLRPIGSTSAWFSYNPLGNYLRSGLTMMATRGLNSVIAPIENSFRPATPDDFDFISAYTFAGDLNDNLFGATERKATLLGLAQGDPNAQVKALARAWGQGEDTYNSPTVAEARAAANIDLGNLGNSLFDTIGEILIDPENLTELSQNITEQNLTNSIYIDATRVLNQDYHRILNGLEPIHASSKNILFAIDENGKVLMDNDTPILTDIGALILRGDPGLLQSTIKSYLNDGKEGIQNVYMNALLDRTRRRTGDDKSKIIRQNTFGDVPEELKLLFDDIIFNRPGDQPYTKAQLQQMSELRKKDKSTLSTDEERTAWETADSTFKNIYAYFNQKDEGKSDVEIIDKFLFENNLKLGDEQISKLYNLHEGFKEQMDLISNTISTANVIYGNAPLKLLKLGWRKAKDLWQKLYANNVSDAKMRQIISVNSDYIQKIVAKIPEEKLNKFKQDLGTNKVPDEDVIKLAEECGVSFDEADEVIKQIVDALAQAKTRIEDIRNLGLYYVNNNTEKKTLKELQEIVDKYQEGLTEEQIEAKRKQDPTGYKQYKEALSILYAARLEELKDETVTKCNENLLTHLQYLKLLGVEVDKKALLMFKEFTVNSKLAVGGVKKKALDYYRSQQTSKSYETLRKEYFNIIKEKNNGKPEGDYITNGTFLKDCTIEELAIIEAYIKVTEGINHDKERIRAIPDKKSSKKQSEISKEDLYKAYSKARERIAKAHLIDGKPDYVGFDQGKYDNELKEQFFIIDKSKLLDEYKDKTDEELEKLILENKPIYKNVANPEFYNEQQAVRQFLQSITNAYDTIKEQLNKKLKEKAVAEVYLKYNPDVDFEYIQEFYGIFNKTQIEQILDGMPIDASPALIPGTSDIITYDYKDPNDESRTISRVVPDVSKVINKETGKTPDFGNIKEPLAYILDDGTMVNAQRKPAKRFISQTMTDASKKVAFETSMSLQDLILEHLHARYNHIINSGVQTLNFNIFTCSDTLEKFDFNYWVKSNPEQKRNYVKTLLDDVLHEKVGDQTRCIIDPELTATLINESDSYVKHIDEILKPKDGGIKQIDKKGNIKVAYPYEHLNMYTVRYIIMKDVLKKYKATFEAVAQDMEDFHNAITKVYEENKIDDPILSERLNDYIENIYENVLRETPFYKALYSVERAQQHQLDKKSTFLVSSPFLSDTIVAYKLLDASKNKELTTKELNDVLSIIIRSKEFKKIDEITHATEIEKSYRTLNYIGTLDEEVYSIIKERNDKLKDAPKENKQSIIEEAEQKIVKKLGGSENAKVQELLDQHTQNRDNTIITSEEKTIEGLNPDSSVAKDLLKEREEQIAYKEQEETIVTVLQKYLEIRNTELYKEVPDDYRPSLNKAKEAMQNTGTPADNVKKHYSVRVGKKYTGTKLYDYMYHLLSNKYGLFDPDNKEGAYVYIDPLTFIVGDNARETAFNKIVTDNKFYSSYVYDEISDLVDEMYDYCKFGYNKKGKVHFLEFKKATNEEDRKKQIKASLLNVYIQGGQIVLNINYIYNDTATGFSQPYTQINMQNYYRNALKRAINYLADKDEDFKKLVKMDGDKIDYLSTLENIKDDTEALKKLNENALKVLESGLEQDKYGLKGLKQVHDMANRIHEKEDVLVHSSDLSKGTAIINPSMMKEFLYKEESFSDLLNDLVHANDDDYQCKTMWGILLSIFKDAIRIKNIGDRKLLSADNVDDITYTIDKNNDMKFTFKVGSISYDLEDFVNRFHLSLDQLHSLLQRDKIIFRESDAEGYYSRLETAKVYTRLLQQYKEAYNKVMDVYKPTNKKDRTLFIDTYKQQYMETHKVNSKKAEQELIKIYNILNNKEFNNILYKHSVALDKNLANTFDIYYGNLVKECYNNSITDGVFDSNKFLDNIWTKWQKGTKKEKAIAEIIIKDRLLYGANKVFNFASNDYIKKQEKTIEETKRKLDTETDPKEKKRLQHILSFAEKRVEYFKPLQNQMTYNKGEILDIVAKDKELFKQIFNNTEEMDENSDYRIAKRVNKNGHYVNAQGHVVKEENAYTTLVPFKDIKNLNPLPHYTAEIIEKVYDYDFDNLNKQDTNNNISKLLYQGYRLQKMSDDSILLICDDNITDASVQINDLLMNDFIKNKGIKHVYVLTESQFTQLKDKKENVDIIPHYVFTTDDVTKLTPNIVNTKALKGIFPAYLNDLLTFKDVEDIDAFKHFLELRNQYTLYDESMNPGLSLLDSKVFGGMQRAATNTLINIFFKQQLDLKYADLDIETVNKLFFNKDTFESEQLHTYIYNKLQQTFGALEDINLITDAIKNAVKETKTYIEDNYKDINLDYEVAADSELLDQLSDLSNTMTNLIKPLRDTFYKYNEQWTKKINKYLKALDFNQRTTLYKERIEMLQNLGIKGEDIDEAWLKARAEDYKNTRGKAILYKELFDTRRKEELNREQNRIKFKNLRSIVKQCQKIDELIKENKSIINNELIKTYIPEEIYKELKATTKETKNEIAKNVYINMIQPYIRNISSRVLERPLNPIEGMINQMEESFIAQGVIIENLIENLYTEEELQERIKQELKKELGYIPAADADIKLKKVYITEEDNLILEKPKKDPDDYYIHGGEKAPTYTNKTYSFVLAQNLNIQESILQNIINNLRTYLTYKKDYNLNNIKNVDSLDKWIEQYDNLDNLDKQIIKLIINNKNIRDAISLNDDTTACQILYKYTVPELKTLSDIKDKQIEEKIIHTVDSFLEKAKPFYLEHIQDISAFIKAQAQIKSTVVHTEDIARMYGTEQLNEDINFFNDMKNKIKTFKTDNKNINHALGILKESLNVADAINKLNTYYSTKNDDGKLPPLNTYAAIISMIEVYKQQYLKEQGGDDWQTYEVSKYEQGNMHRVLDTIKAFRNRGVFTYSDNPYSMNIISELRKPINYINDLRGLIKAKNDDLSRWVLNEDNYNKYNRQNTIKRNLVESHESNRKQLRDEFARTITSVLFKPYVKGDVNTKIDNIYRTLIYNYNTDIYNEIEARSLNEANTSTPTTLYKELRTQFTQLYIDMGLDVTNTKFVHIFELCEALTNMKDDQSQALGYYKYTELVSQLTEEQIKILDTHIKELLNYWNSKNNLIDMNESKLRALMGYIWYMRESSKNDYQPSKKAYEYVQNYIEHKNTYRALRDTNILEQINNIINDDNIENKDEEVVKLLNDYYKEYQLEEEEQKKISEFIKSIRTTANKTIPIFKEYDTYGFVKEDVATKKQKRLNIRDEFKDWENQIKEKSDRISRLKKELNDLDEEKRKFEYNQKDIYSKRDDLYIKIEEKKQQIEKLKEDKKQLQKQFTTLLLKDTTLQNEQIENYKKEQKDAKDKTYNDLFHNTYLKIAQVPEELREEVISKLAKYHYNFYILSSKSVLKLMYDNQSQINKNHFTKTGVTEEFKNLFTENDYKRIEYLLRNTYQTLNKEDATYYDAFKQLMQEIKEAKDFNDKAKSTKNIINTTVQEHYSNDTDEYYKYTKALNNGLNNDKQKKKLRSLIEYDKRLLYVQDIDEDSELFADYVYRTFRKNLKDYINKQKEQLLKDFKENKTVNDEVFTKYKNALITDARTTKHNIVNKLNRAKNNIYKFITETNKLKVYFNRILKPSQDNYLKINRIENLPYDDTLDTKSITAYRTKIKGIYDKLAPQNKIPQLYIDKYNELIDQLKNGSGHWQVLGELFLDGDKLNISNIYKFYKHKLAIDKNNKDFNTWINARYINNEGYYIIDTDAKAKELYSMLDYFKAIHKYGQLINQYKVELPDTEEYINRITFLNNKGITSLQSNESGKPTKPKYHIVSKPGLEKEALKYVNEFADIAQIVDEKGNIYPKPDKYIKEKVDKVRAKLKEKYGDIYYITLLNIVDNYNMKQEYDVALKDFKQNQDERSYLSIEPYTELMDKYLKTILKDPNKDTTEIKNAFNTYQIQTKTLQETTNERYKLSKEYRPLSRLSYSKDKYNNKKHQLEILETDLKDAKTILANTKASYQTISKDIEEVFGKGKNTNISLYKRYNNIEKFNDEDALQHALKNAEQYVSDKFQYMGKTGIEAFKELIKNKDLHDSVIDTIITSLNYMKQQPKQNSFITLDMETMKDEKGVPIPYQITIIKWKNGKIVHVQDTYFNNYMVYRGITFDENNNIQLSKELENFKEQQKEVWGEDYFTEERFNNLIKKLQGIENSPVVMDTLINTLLASEDPIVAHNGINFDFQIFNRYIKDFSHKMFENYLYKIIKTHGPDKIFDNPIDYGDEQAAKQRLQEILNELKKLLYNDKGQKLDIENVLNSSQYNLVKQQAKALIQELIEVNSILSIKKYTQDLTGKLKLNNNIFDDKDNGDLHNIIDAFEKYIDDGNDKNLTDNIYKIFESNMEQDFNEQDLKEAVDDFMKNVLNTYVAYVEKNSSFLQEDDNAMKRLITEIANRIEDIEKTNIDKEENVEDIEKEKKKAIVTDLLEDQEVFNLNPKETLTQYDERITVLNSLIDDLNSDIMKDERTELFKKEQQEIEKQQEFLKQYQKDLNKYKEDLKKAKDHKDEQLKALEDLSKKWQERNTNLLGSVLTNVNMRFQEELEKHNILNSRGINYAKLSFNIANTQRAVDATITDIYNLIRILNNQKVVLDDGTVINIKDILLQRLNRNTLLEINADNIDNKAQQLEEAVIKITNALKTLEDEQDINNKKKQITEEIDKIKATLVEELKKKYNYEYKNLKDFNEYIKNQKQDDIPALVDLYTRIRDLEEINLEKDLNTVYRRINIILEDQLNRYNNTLGYIKIYKKVNREAPKVEDIEELITKLQDALIQNINDNDEQIKSAIMQKIQSDISLSPTILKNSKGEVNEEHRKAYIENQKVLHDTTDEDLTAIGCTKSIEKTTDRCTQHVFRFRKDRLYETTQRTDGNITGYTLSEYDPNTDTTQKVLVHVDGNNKITDVILRIQYKLYNNAHPFNKPRVVNTDIKLKDYNSKDFYNNQAIFKDIDYRYLAFPTGVDTMKNTIDNLVNHWKQINTLNKNGTYQLHDIKEINAKLGNKYKFVKNTAFDIKEDLELIDADTLVQDTLAKYITVFNEAKQGISFKDLNAMYSAIHQQVYSRFNSLDPSKILTDLVDDVLGTDGVITTNGDPSKLKGLGPDGNINIAPYVGSEGSAGRVFVIENLRTPEVLFKQSLLPMRGLLYSKPKLATKTPLGITNILLVHAKDNTTNLTDLIVDPKNKNKYKEFLETTRDYYKKRNMYFDEREFKNTMNTALELTKVINGKRQDLFTPNIDTFENAKKYRDGVLFKTGINLSITYANDPRAFEDVILMDEDRAKALGIAQTSKLWVSAGFKGGVRLIKGLKDQYGTTLVATAASIQKRGCMDIFLNFSLTKIMYHVLGYTKLTDKELTPAVKKIIAQMKKYDTIEDAQEAKAMFAIVDNKLVVNPNVNMGRYFDSIGFNPEKFVKQKIPAAARKIEGVYQIRESEDKPINEFNFDPNTECYVGETYCMMDTENYAPHLQSNPKVVNVDDIIFTLRNYKGGYDHGSQFSFSVDTFAGMEVGTKLQKHLLENKQQTKIIDDALLILTEGYNKVRLNDGTTIDFAEYIKEKFDTWANKNRLVKEINDNDYSTLTRLLVNDIKEGIQINNFNKNIDYFIIENIKLNAYNAATQGKYIEQIKDNITKINNSIKQQTANLMYTDRGLFYSNVYSKFMGMRAQLIANTSLELGDIKVPKSQLQSLLQQMDKDAIHKGTDITITYKGKEYKTAKALEDAFTKFIDNKDFRSVRELIELMEYNGLYEGYAFKLTGAKYKSKLSFDTLVHVDKIEINDLKPIEIKALAIRTPLQNAKSTPIVTIKGMTNHAGIEAYSYLYESIGGDNDGDALSLMFLDYDSSEKDGDLYKLNSKSKDDKGNYLFYDKGYFDKVNKKSYAIEHWNKGTNTAKVSPLHYKSTSFLYAYWGKKAGLDISSQVNTRGDADGHYTWYDVINFKYNPNKIEIKNPVSLPTLENVEPGEDAEKSMMFWVSAYIANKTKNEVNMLGDNGNYVVNYNDLSSVEKYYKDHQPEIDKMRQLHIYINNLIDSGNEKELNKIASQLLNKEDATWDNLIDELTDTSAVITLERSRVSKIGVTMVGQIRKSILTGVLHHEFSHLNDSRSGKEWKEAYGLDPNNITIRTLLQDEDGKLPDLDNLDEDKIRKILQKKLKIDPETADLEELVKFINTKLDARKIVKDNINIIETVLTKTPNAGEIKKYLDILLKQAPNNDIINTIKNNLTDIDPALVYWLRSLMFGRASNKAARIIQEDRNKFIDSIIDAKLLTRTIANEIDALAQDAINQSKHGSLIFIAGNKINSYVKKAGMFLEDNVHLLYNLGNEEELNRTIAMGAASFSPDDKKLLLHKEEFINKPDLRVLKIFNAPPTKDNLQKMFNQSLISAMFSNDTLGSEYKPYKNALTAVNNITNIMNDAFGELNMVKDKKDELEKSIMILKEYNIPFYRIMQGYLNGLFIINSKNKDKNKVELPKLHYLFQFWFADIKNNYYNFIKNYRKDYTFIVDYFAGIDQLDSTHFDENNNLILEKGYDYKDHNNQIFEDILKELDTKDPDMNEGIAIQNILFNKYADLYDLFDFDGSTTISDYAAELINRLRTEFELAKAVKQDAAKAYENIRTKTNIQKDAILKKLTFEITNAKTRQAAANKIDLLNQNVEVEKSIELIQKLEAQIESLTKKINNKNREINRLNDSIINKNEVERLKEERDRLINKKKEFIRRILRNSIMHNLKGLAPYIKDSQGNTIYDYSISNDDYKPLTKRDIDALYDSKLYNMHIYQQQIPIVYKNYKNGNKEIDYEYIFNWYKQNYEHYQFTLVRDPKKQYKETGINPTEDEGLLKNIIDIFYTKYKKDKQGNYIEQDKYEKFNSLEELQTFMQDAMKDTSLEFTLDGKKYKGFKGTMEDLNILYEFISPTLIRLEINSPKDIKTLIDLSEQGYDIGITNINDLMTATEEGFKPYKSPSKFTRIVNKFNFIQKLAMRFNPGFLVRNAMDAATQIFVDMHRKLGYGGLLNTQQINRLMIQNIDLYSIYEYLSQERLITNIDIVNHFNVLKQQEINTDIYKENFEYINNKINNFININENNGDLKEIINKFKYYKKEYEKILNAYIEHKGVTKAAVLKALENYVKPLWSLNFAQYYKNFNLLKYSDNKKLQKMTDKYKDRLKDFESALFELSAFMNTNAENDYLKKQQYELLNKLLDTGEIYKDKDLKDIQKEIESLKKQTSESLASYLLNKNPAYAIYDKMNSTIENLARITMFMFNRTMYGTSFNRSVTESLKSWFNYGLRSPYENSLMFDIPYISFPLRSIGNWMDRLLDPKVAVLIDDIIDGIYGQYKDEDGQYSRWTKFMIANGWVPITNKMGIRLGSSIMDIQSLIHNPAGYFEEKTNPLLRGLMAFIESGDLMKGVKQLATAGALTKFAKLTTSPDIQRDLGIDTSATVKTIANSSSIFFEYNNYEQYVPTKYRNQNNRWIKYEDIYKEYYTKFGNRRSSNNPYYNVKNILWKQRVRAMQSRFTKK